MDLNRDGDYSDDEVFFGKLSLKEVRKHILMDIYQKNMSRDCKIIEMNSEPNMHFRGGIGEFAGEELKSSSDPQFNRTPNKTHLPYNSPDLKSEDSFLEIEKAVTECSKTNVNLDNTLDVVDFILNHAPPQAKENKHDIDNLKVPKEEISQSDSCADMKKQNEEKARIPASVQNPQTPIAGKPVIKGAIGPGSIKKIGSVLNTPTLNKKAAPNVFKTPKQPLSARKETPLKKTPCRSKEYEHITSPIASYIKNCPQVRLLKDVHPKKPLPSTSIPKLMKNTTDNKLSNKENVMLPPLAYRSAKKTVINVNKENLLQGQWMQKFTSSLRKPVVIKHDHRENATRPLLTQQEDSFADLSLHQAEISVCTQKTAFHKAT